jgi:hypothetical protein
MASARSQAPLTPGFGVNGQISARVGWRDLVPCLQFDEANTRSLAAIPALKKTRRRKRGWDDVRSSGIKFSFPIAHSKLAHYYTALLWQ